jgi:hypothetical protein
MDQKSLQALLQELQGLDELPKEAANPAAEEASDYTAWYEDYVRSKSAPALPDANPEQLASATTTAAPAEAQVSNAPQDIPPTDLRKLTYAQALPIISRLARDESFLDALQEVSVCPATSLITAGRPS